MADITMDDKKKNSLVIFTYRLPCISSLYKDALNSNWDVYYIYNNLCGGWFKDGYLYKQSRRGQHHRKIPDGLLLTTEETKIIKEANILYVSLEKYVESYSIWGQTSSIRPIIVLIDDQYFLNKYTDPFDKCKKIEKDGWHSFIPDAIYQEKIGDYFPEGAKFFAVGMTCSSVVIVNNFADMVSLFEQKNNGVSSSKTEYNSSKMEYNSNKTEYNPECSICLDNRKNMMCYPCRHVCMCRECSQNIKKCPLCRTNIESLIEVYI
jgi:hypothetical protein